MTEAPRSISDWRALAELSKLGSDPASLPPMFVYRACAAAANAGQTLAEEASLTDSAKALLETRRRIFAGDVPGARRAVESHEHTEPLLAADAVCIQGILVHRERGDLALAIAAMENSAKMFLALGDTHRMLRAQINALIFRHDLREYVGGKLLALEQECVRLGHHDLAGLICRGRAIELCAEGGFQKALVQGELADHHFALEGCPEDRAVGKLVLAILCKLLGMDEQSVRHRDAVMVQGRRISQYLEILGALENGKIPKLDPSHALAKTPWNKSAALLLKSNSVLGKLLKTLQSGSYEKSQLIETLWGTRAIGPAYENRLRVAVTKLRKNYAVPVAFDGARYSLAQK